MEVIVLSVSLNDCLSYFSINNIDFNFIMNLFRIQMIHVFFYKFNQLLTEKKTIKYEREGVDRTLDAGSSTLLICLGNFACGHR
jgi:hypothetical protein